MVHSRYACKMFLACGLLVALHSPAETLRQSIVARGIDPTGLDSTNLDKEITSGSALDEADLFLTAYYRDDGSKTLHGPVQVEMQDKSKHSWRHAEIDTSSVEPSAGSICGIDHSKNGFYLYAHINPSAGVSIILSPSLELRGSVYGSFLGDYADGTVVYANSTVHFASTHPGGVSLYNPKSKADRRIYPMKPYQAVRLGHIAKVKAAYDNLGGEWLRINNNRGDPELFTDYVGKAATSDATDSLAFITSFDNGDTLTEEGRLELMYLGKIRDALKEHPLDAGLTSENAALFSDALRRGFVSAGRNHVDDRLLDVFDPYPEIRDMVKALPQAKPPEGMSWQEYFPVLDQRWASPDTWRVIEKAVNASPEFTKVVYVYRNVCKGGNLEYREILNDDVKRRFGDVPLSKLLEPQMLHTIFETHP